MKVRSKKKFVHLLTGIWYMRICGLVAIQPNIVYPLSSSKQLNYQLAEFMALLLGLCMCKNNDAVSVS